MKFKIGDKVKILFIAAEDPHDMQFTIREIGTVKVVNTKGKYYVVEFEDGVGWCYTEEMLEKVK